MKEHAIIARISRAWARRLCIAAGTVLALCLLAWAGVPPLVKWLVQSQGTEALGREVQLGSVDFHPWNLELTLHDLRIGAAAGARDTRPQFTVGRIAVNLHAMSLLRLAPIIEALQVDSPHLRMTRLADGRYDLDDILRRFAPKDAARSSSDSPRFALYNVQLRDGEVSFDDEPVSRHHEIRGALLTLPFLSALPSQVDITVEPRLAFTFDGVRFDTGARGTPFSRSHATAVTLHTGDIDLAPWRAYLPGDLPLDLQRGHLQGDLEFRFAVRDDGTPEASLHGKVHALDWAITDRQGAPLAAWRALDISITELQPLTRHAALGPVRVEGLAVPVVRDGRGHLPFATHETSASAGPGKPWSVSVASIELADAHLSFSDASTRPGLSVSLDGINAASGPLTWPLKQPASLSIKTHLSADVPGRLRWQGQVAADASFESAGDATQLLLTLKRASIDELELTDASARQHEREPQGWKQLAVLDARVDLAHRDVQLGTVKLSRASLEAVRGKDGALSIAGWLLSEPSAHSAAATASREVPAPWSVLVHEAIIDDTQFRWRDARPNASATPGTVEVDVTGLQASLRDFQWPAGKPAPLSISARVAGPTSQGTRAGSIDWKGSIAAQQSGLRGTLRVDRFPLHAIEPYFGAGLNVSVLRAEAGWQGEVALQLAPGGPEASVRGNALLADLRVNSRNAITGEPTSDELLSWQALNLRDVKFSLRPKARPRLEVGDATLGDFYSRLVVSEQGRFNLSDVAAPEGAASSPPGGFAVSAAPAAPVPPPASAASAPPPQGEPLPVDISMGGVRLVNGRIDFSDHFVRPNYSAVLSELDGRLGAFHSGTREMATLELRGRMASTAALEIRGSLNPTANPLALDVGARASDLELAPLSPYAGKYAGYAIERGKLSMEVHYTVQPDGHLVASNHVVLNQLTFGEKIDSPEATKLPVLLAVALLKDRNGIIDVNLPVNGSLHDPQFSVGSIVVKVIVNLLTKALTAPFALLAGSGSEDLSTIEFVPGTATLAQSGRVGLEKVAKALVDRPALKMTVTGVADTVGERDAMQAAQLEQRLLALRRRDALRAGGAASAPGTLTEAERAPLVKSLYASSDIPNKPRNFIGLAKDIPLRDMEALLKSRILITDDSARELALQRGVAVRDALVAHGLPSDRLFLAAPRLRASDDEGAWTPRVRLVLSNQ